MRHGVKSLLGGALVAAVMWPGVAAAQFGGGGGGGPQMDPAKAAAARALEAEGVAHDVGVTGDAVGKLVAAYKTSRESQAKALEEMMATAERGPGMMLQMQEINDGERTKLKTALDAFLKPDQVKAAMSPLGTFAREWDRFADVIGGLGLAKDKQFGTLTLISKYVVDVDAARSAAMASGDIEGMRAASQENKVKLDEALKGVLTAEQLAKWTEGTARRGGGPGGGGGGGAPGAPGAGAPPPPPAPKN